MGVLKLDWTPLLLYNPWRGSKQLCILFILFFSAGPSKTELTQIKWGFMLLSSDST